MVQPPVLQDRETHVDKGAIVNTTLGHRSMSVEGGGTRQFAQFPRARVLYDFIGEESDELDMLAGQEIRVMEECDNGWWKGFNYDRVGYFPSNFVQPLAAGEL